MAIYIRKYWEFEEINITTSSAEIVILKINEIMIIGLY